MTTAVKMKPIIEWQDAPTMNPRNTNQLRRLIERRRAAYLWGKKHIVTPRLCSEVFGNGRLLLGLSPVMFRPNYFVVRIDSSWQTSNWAQGAMRPCDWLDRVCDAIEEEYPEWPWSKSYGLRWADDGGDDQSSRIDFSDGCEWWEMQWPRDRLRKVERP